MRARFLLWLERVLFPVKWRKVDAHGDLVRMSRREIREAKR